MQESPEPADVLAASDPVAAFWQAHAHGKRICLRTSGTSSQPRWVVRSTRSWSDSFAAFSELADVDAASRAWIPGPLGSTMNLFARVHASSAAAEVVDDPAECTHAHLTPTALERALDTGALRAGTRAVVAGDLLRPSLRERAVGAGVRVHHYYGASELSFVAWGSASDDLRAFPGVEVDVRDGEIWARSDYLCEDYAGAGDPGPLRREPNGWATVGDLGSLDATGVLTVHGRGSDAVTTAGATVLLADVEAVLRRHAHGEVWLAGLEHQRLGAVLVAAVTDPADAERLASVARDLLPPAQRPRRWFAVDSVPVTPAGKVDRQALAALVAAATPLPMAR